MAIIVKDKDNKPITIRYIANMILSSANGEEDMELDVPNFISVCIDICDCLNTLLIHWAAYDLMSNKIDIDTNNSSSVN